MTDIDFYHAPVMLEESITGLNIKPGGVYADGTVGGGGHSAGIAARLSGAGRLICVDRDADAIKAARVRLSEFGNVDFVQANFANLSQILENKGVSRLDGALLDLGVSSWQLDEPSRGFSFMKDAPLDMRMDRDTGFTAFDVVNTYTDKDLANIFFTYGEEKFARRIADRIVRTRSAAPIATTLELSELISAAVPKAARDGKHPATRAFQAIRIEVNNELEILENAVLDIVDRLSPGGRLCVITFHSLEDRIIKNAFKKLENPCVCPRELPLCVCGKSPVVKILTKKPITAAKDEEERNPRSRSAKLRIVEKR